MEVGHPLPLCHIQSLPRSGSLFSPWLIPIRHSIREEKQKTVSKTYSTPLNYAFVTV